MTPPSPARPNGAAPPRTGSARSTQADLLQELREAAPMAVAPEAAGRRPQAAPSPTATERPSTTFELRVTPQRWTSLRISGVPGGPGVSAELGPVRLSLRMPGR